MTDIRANDRTPLDEDDRLPWLEAVDDDDDRDGPSAAKLIAFVVIGLVAIGLIVGGLFWMGNRTGGAVEGEPELIAAPGGDYKVAPDAPGGMKVEDEGDIQIAASEGADPKAKIDTAALPETPVTQAPPKAKQAAPKTAAAAPAPKAAPKQAPPAQAMRPEPKVDTRVAAAPAAAGATIQLGAFSSQASANSAWKALSSRFKYLAPLSHSVTPTKSGDRTLYRLRASGPDARNLCGRLRVAGESCVAVD